MTAFMKNLLLVLSAGLMGCGATSARLSLAPTLDGAGRGGFEAFLSLGVGMPLDYTGRSHHFVQALISGGGGMDSRTHAGMGLAALDADYLYRGDQVMDIRVGGRMSMRGVGGRGEPMMYGLGASFAWMPILREESGQVLVLHWNLGAEFRIDHFWSDLKEADHTLFSPALVADANLLITGD